jgi:putative sigma-54 modulation protein
MIERLEIAGVHTHVDDKLKAYVTKKIGKLDKYLPKHARASAHAEVKLKENKTTKSKKSLYACEVVLYLPGEVLRVEDETLNSYAAVDIVEAKLKNLMQKYKELHTPQKFHRRALARFKRQIA